MNVPMSLILYNPLEAAILLWCAYLFRKKDFYEEKFELKNFIVDCYIFGTIFFLIQLPMNYANESTIFEYTLLSSFIVLPIVMCLYCDKCGIVQNIVIIYVYIFSMCFIMDKLKAQMVVSLIAEDVRSEFFVNLITKTIQFCIVLLIIIGRYILKKFLITSAEKNVKKTVAATIFGYGEPKLSKKLQDEIK